MHHIKSDAAPGNLRHLLGGTESGQEQEVKEFAFAQARRKISGLHSPLNHLATNGISLNTLAVVSDAHHQLASVMPGFNHDACLLGLATCAALFGHFNTVIDGISNDVIEWSLKARQDVAVNWNVGADNIKSHALAKLTGHITNHSWESGDALAEWSHAAADHFVIQRRGYLFGATEEILKVKDSICQRCLGATNGIARDGDACWVATAHGCFKGFTCARQFAADGSECASQGRRSAAFNH